MVIAPTFHKPHYAVTDYISSLEPKSVFEFGSAWGKNFILLERYIPNVRCVGVDINRKAVEIAKNDDRDVREGDETALKDIPSKSFDVAFTCSVLNHLTPYTARMIVQELRRIAKKCVVACECTEKDEWRWFQHPYEEWGYKDIKKRAWSPVIDAFYRLFIIESKHL